MALSDFILGRHLGSDEDKDERVGPMTGISVFGLDALSSAAYGPEAALTVLISLGIAGVGFSLPITVAVSTILAIVYFSYRQTIAGYPEGAGSYTVAKENLGTHAGLFAAAALMIDYTLNVAVGISAGSVRSPRRYHFYNLTPYSSASLYYSCSPSRISEVYANPGLRSCHPPTYLSAAWLLF